MLSFRGVFTKKMHPPPDLHQRPSNHRLQGEGLSTSKIEEVVQVSLLLLLLLWLVGWLVGWLFGVFLFFFGQWCGVFVSFV